MAKAELTTLGIRVIDPTAADIFWDTEIGGFGLRTRKSPDPKRWRWVYSYREKGSREQVKLTQEFAAFTPKQGREWAVDQAVLRKRGAGDRAEKKAKREATAEQRKRRQEERQNPTVAGLWDAYWQAEGRLKEARLQERRLAAGSSKEARHGDRQLWRDHLQPAFGPLKVKAVKPTDIERFKAAKCESPGACNRALALLSRMFTLAALWGYREGCAPEHPVKRVTRYPERPSEFHFSTLEWGRLLIAADEDAIGEQADAQVGYQHKEKNRGGGLAVRMLAYTGARRSEVMTAHWDQVEFLPGVDGRSGGGGAFWTVESTNTKSGRPITRYLPRDLAERLATWRPAAMEAQRRDAVIAVGAANRRWWLFPQGPDPSKPLIGLHNVWERIKKAAGVQQGRIHDLRHTAATMLRQQGVPVSAIQVQLGHVSREITLRYAHSTHEELRRTGEALARLAEAAEDEARATAFQVPEPVDLAQERTRRQSRAAL